MEMSNFISESEEKAKLILKNVKPSKQEELEKAKNKIDSHFKKLIDTMSNLGSVFVDLAELRNSKTKCELFIYPKGNFGVNEPLIMLELGYHRYSVLKKYANHRGEHVYLYELDEKAIYFIVNNWDEINRRITMDIEKLFKDRVLKMNKTLAYNKELIGTLSNFNSDEN
jgi:hypothetical protein